MKRNSDTIPLYTVDEIISLLSRDGYKLNKRTFQFYVQSGLLPKGLRKGQDTGGVKFFYPFTVIDTIKWIFELKSKGYNLNEIKKTLLLFQQDDPAGKGRGPVGRLPGTRQEKAMLLAGSGIAPEGRDFFRRVMDETPGGDALVRCLQCGTCGGSCPSIGDMDYTPRHIIAMLRAGLKQEVLDSNTPWFCVSCYYCTVRCPQQIPITDVMYTLKQIAVSEGTARITDAYDFSRAFVNFVEQYGRSFDFGLAMRYRLTHTPSDKVSGGSLALKLYKKERIVLAPSRIEGLDQLHRIIEKAKKAGERS